MGSNDTARFLTPIAKMARSRMARSRMLLLLLAGGITVFMWSSGKRRTPSKKTLRTTSRVHVVQVWAGDDASMPEWFPRVLRLNQAYAHRHGYTYELLRRNSKVATPLLEKIQLFKQRLEAANAADVFLYLDTDAVVWNQSIALETFDYSRYDMILSGHEHGFGAHGENVRPKTPSGHPAGINTGVWIVRGTKWSKELFKMWYSLRTSGCCSPGDDQVLLHHIIQQNTIPDFHDHVRFVRAARLNMDDAPVRLGKAQKPSAEFIIHCWGGLKSQMPTVLRDVELHQKPTMLSLTTEPMDVLFG